MEKCHFSTKKGCAALECVECPEHCTFAKTKAEYHAGIQRTKDLLAAKGLEAVRIALPDGGQIMTTRRVAK